LSNFTLAVEQTVLGFPDAGLLDTADQEDGQYANGVWVA
jgi:hypothetical protein